MPKVTFANEAVSIEVEQGKSIKDAADALGIKLFEGFWAKSIYHCSGWGGCLGAGCRIWVQGAEGTVSKRSLLEKLRPTHSGSVRLACQAKVLADVEVRTQPGALLDTKANMKWDPDPRPARWKERLAGQPKGAAADTTDEADETP